MKFNLVELRLFSFNCVDTVLNLIIKCKYNANYNNLHQIGRRTLYFCVEPP